MENRVEKRDFLAYSFELYNRETQDFIGSLVNISSGGIMATCREALSPNTSIPMRLQLPTEIKGRTSLEFDTLSIWCKPDIEPNSFAIGFLLYNLAWQDKEIVDFLIKKFGC